jgi:D-alanyl-lipoteichoic acid acyltransferase DltB (MBOAT superfamily)
MVQLFILNTNFSNKQKLSFGLMNIGKDISCKCYFDAFNECGYTSFSHIYDEDGSDNLIKTKMTRDSCDINYEMYMEFIPNMSSGGNYKKSKTKKTKKSKTKKSKTKKSKTKKSKTKKAKN